PIPHAQLFDVEATLRAYTCDAADCLRIHTGRLAPGYPADIVFLDRDPLTADWRLDPPQLAGLLIGGEIVRDPRASMSRA
ncbi:MAG: hypothetical protein EXS00_06610, partial [Phycisphaerales bacterium]|nr:hypothetical protein [Phycisphaerales bacterium]